MKREDFIFVFVKCLGLYILVTYLPSFITTSVAAWIVLSHPIANPASPSNLYTFQGPILGAIMLMISFQLVFNTNRMAAWVQRNDKKG